MGAARVRPRGRGKPGAPEWVALGVAALVILALTFALGLLVGRQWARQTQPAVAAESARTSRRGGLTEVGSEGAPHRQEKLTFYQTLTAPLGPVSPEGRADSSPKPGGETKPRANSERAPERGVEPAPPRTAGVDGQERRRLAPDEAKRSGEHPEPRPEWTVQVGVFKNLQPAAAVRKHLAERGFAAEVVPTMGEDGHARYQVRVGAFRTKEEAVRTAERVRSDRSLPTVVTLR